MPDCILCKWARKWAGPDFKTAGTCDISEKSDAWERAHSNEAELWAREPDTDRVDQAIAISKSDPAASFQMVLDLAKEGSVWAMTRIAWFYGFGKNGPVDSDFQLAADWYSQAIGAGSWMATRYYAQLMEKFEHFTDSEKILKMGVEKNWLPAYYWLAWYRHKHSKSWKTYREIMPLLEYAAERGHPNAQLLLAKLMMRGKFGLLQIPRGIRLFREQVAICVEAQEKLVQVG